MPNPEIFTPEQIAELNAAADKFVSDLKSVQAPARDKRGRFPPGTSGNPNGRLRGSRNAVTETVEKWAADNLETLLSSLLPLAANHPAAMKMLLDRMTPPDWRRPPDFRFGPINSQADLDGARNRALTAHDMGELDRDGFCEILDRLARIKALLATPVADGDTHTGPNVTRDQPVDPA
jgi:hypothetical protein